MCVCVSLERQAVSAVLLRSGGQSSAVDVNMRLYYRCCDVVLTLQHLFVFSLRCSACFPSSDVHVLLCV